MSTLLSASRPGELSKEQPTPSPLRYTRPEAAARLRISLRTLDRLIAFKEIAVKRVGRRVFINEESLAQFIKRDHETGSVRRGVQ